MRPHLFWLAASLAAMPAAVSAADQARLKAAYAQSVSTEIRPALTRLRTFISDEYRPKARTSVGLGDMPGGDRLYAFLVEVSTTTDLTPDMRVIAPAWWLMAERESEPAPGMQRKKPPIRLPRPEARHCRLKSSGWRVL